MMKRFKHRKTGEITIYEDGVLKSSGFCVEIGVEPSSEFWEELIEKDFEILSFRTSINEGKTWNYARKISNGRFLREDVSEDELPLRGTEGDGMGATEEYMLNEWVTHSDEICEIYSIKRLSDGEVFTVGDKITGTLSLFEPQKGYVKITGFRINNNKLEIEIETGVITDNRGLTFPDGSKGSFSFLTIKKYKSLFTTEDGYEIFLGDSYYYIDENYVLYEQKKAVTTSGIAGFKYFKEKTNAEWYIFENKPVLSLKDVQSIYVSAKPGYKKNGVEQEYYDKLCDLIKSKL